MKSQKLIIAMATAGSLMLLSGCDDGDDVNVDLGSNNPTPTNPGTGNVVAPTNCPVGTGSIASISGQATAVCDLPASIDANATMSSDFTYFMDDFVVVGNGDGRVTTQGGNLVVGGDNEPLINATLTIEPGTQIFADNDATLKITRGSNIIAEGTADAPITFSGRDEGFDGSQEWGGVVISGFGIDNSDTDPAGGFNIDAEARLGFYGGDDNTDDSGIFKFVRIAEGGFPVVEDEEINGLTLLGVGSGTTIENIQVDGNADDGIEFFGGAANVKNMVLSNMIDDSIDYASGYQGNIQFVIVSRPNADSGKGIEADNKNGDPTLTPRARPTLANITFVAGDDTEDAGAQWRRGAGGFLHNSIIAGGQVCFDVDTQGAEITSTELALNNVLFNCAADTAGDAEDGGSDFAAPLVAVGGAMKGNPQLDEDFVPASADAQLGATVDFATVPVTGGINTADSNFLVQTDYLGAIDPRDPDLWYEGWILPDTLVLPESDLGLMR